jgi:hypothetical protein
MAENTIQVESITIRKLFEKNLVIPEYQRPYKWKEKNVIQLLNDIIEALNADKKTYRIGTVILHKEGSNLNIVDGQQRLVTITLILHFLGEHQEKLPLLKSNFSHIDSKNNIAFNYGSIKNWFNGFNDDQKKELKKYILENCDFIKIELNDISEAFQLFDSQNARGKALEPYDLLKAFHLREMRFDSEDDRMICVKTWEDAVDNNTLKSIFSDHFFKIRKWSKNEINYNFTKDDIEEFKGVSLHQEQKYLFENAIRILDGFVENAKNDKVLRNYQLVQTYPFSITMPIINGKRFFEYVDFYIQAKKTMLSEKGSENFYNFYKEMCLKYEGAGRSGDEKVRNLYENIMFLFIDRFGYIDKFNEFYEAFYKETYQIRCLNKSIRLETIINSEAIKILHQINEDISPEKLKKYQFKKYDITKTEAEMVKGIEIIKNFINNGTKQK